MSAQKRWLKKPELNNLKMTDLPKTSAPAARALVLIGVKTLEDLAKHSEKELLALHGFGPKSIHKLTPILAKKGLSFAK